MSNSTEIEEELESAVTPSEEPEQPEPEKVESEKAEPEKAAPEEAAEADAGPGQDGEDEPSEVEAAVGKAPAEKERPRRERRLDGRVIAAAVVLFLLTASLVGSAFLWRAWTSSDEKLQAQQQVRTRSAEFAQAFLLYENTDLDGWEKRLTALAVPEYKSAIGQAVKMQFPLITELEADSKVTVREVFANDFDGTVAKTMVVADTQITSKEFVRTVTGMRLLVELNLVKGEWLVSGVGVLGIDDESMTDDKGNAVDPEKLDVPEVSPSAVPSSGTP
ncbi:hypothetical protein ABGB12_33920 [Actinocorallia sp. B10E7]|uniref:hypothetical protein n=1 Tax=Actinocorallia sp. B10E7 TaxID=3153558 RepID=UPI00325D587E